MKIETKTDFYYMTNTYIVSSSTESIIIDPTISFLNLSKEIQDSLKMVFLTHGHYDHFTEIESYKGKGLSFYMHEKAYEKLQDDYKNFSYALYKPIRVSLDNEKVVFVSEGNTINTSIGDIKIVELPGHTDCSIGIIIDSNIFLGDCIFKEGIGRCDLYSGDINLMKKTIERVKTFPDLNVYPGHGPSTSISYILKNNYYFK